MDELEKYLATLNTQFSTSSMELLRSVYNLGRNSREDSNDEELEFLEWELRTY